MAIMLVFIGEFQRLIIQSLSIGLSDKILISMLYVVFSYGYMIFYCFKRKKIITPLFLIIFLSIFFYYGQHLLAVFFPNYLYTEQVNHVLDGKLNDSSIIHATFIAVECLLCVFAGDFSKTFDSTKDEEAEIADYDIKLQALKYVGWFFLLISIYPTVRLQLALNRLNYVYGYLGRRALETDPNYYQILGLNPMVSAIAKYFLISIYALLIAYKGKKYRFLIYGLVVMYCALYYFTGSRYEIVKLLVVIFLIETIWIKTPERKDLRKYLRVGLIVVLAFTAGSVIRTAGMHFSDVLAQASLGDMLWEPGITFTSISNVIDKCPSVVDFFYGKSIIGAVLQCLPAFLRFGFFEKYTLHTSATFAHLYYNTTTHGYGSSFVAEGYYNLGVLVYIYMFLYGLFLGWITRILKNAKSTRSPYSFLALAVTCGSLVYGVRNDLSSIPREILYTTGVFIVITFFVEQLIRHNKLSNG